MKAAGLTSVALLLGSCGTDGVPWATDDHRRIYEATLRSLREELDTDTLFVDPRPRALIRADGSFTMGDFSEFADPVLSQALGDDTLAVSCRPGGDSRCAPASDGRRVAVSEVYAIGPRDAGVLASWVDGRTDPTLVRGFVLRLRSTRGRWTVVRIDDGNTAGRGSNP